MFCCCMLIWEPFTLCYPFESEIYQTRAQLSHPLHEDEHQCESVCLCLCLATLTDCTAKPLSFSSNLQRQKAHCVHIAEINCPSLCTIRSVKEN